MPVVHARHSILLQIDDELVKARKYAGFNSLHEVYAVLLEEVDEFWAHVKTNQQRRDLAAARTKLVHIAATAVWGIQCIDAGRGRV